VDADSGPGPTRPTHARVMGEVEDRGNATRRVEQAQWRVFSLVAT
jgi:hypothetical protein